jgi:hypothetical protein
MNLEEIDRLLKELPAMAPEQTPSEPLPERIESTVLGAYRAMARSVAIQEPDPVAIERARERQRAEARQRHAERIRSERAQLERRMSPRLLARLRADQSPCGLLLGPSGEGKTAAMDWLRVRWRGHFVHARQLASSERRHGLGEGYPPELGSARGTRVLYLDDVGAEEQRDLGTLQELLDYRYRNGLATFATSGLRSDELKAHLGAPYVRRLVDQHVKRGDDEEWPVLLVDLFQASALRSLP